ncbi:MAG: hypothetical protein J5942_07630 [Prevotella sp.]|nr:hypothetical protein [Prevotella sp.]
MKAKILLSVCLLFSLAAIFVAKAERSETAAGRLMVGTDVVRGGSVAYPDPDDGELGSVIMRGYVSRGKTTLQITMGIYFDWKNIYGYYYYDKYRKKIKLSGSFNEEGKLVMVNYYKQNGKWIEGDEFEGFYQKGVYQGRFYCDDGLPYYFKLKRIK